MDGDTIEFLAGGTQQLIAGELKTQIQPDLVKVIGGLGGQTYCHLHEGSVPQPKVSSVKCWNWEQGSSPS